MSGERGALRVVKLGGSLLDLDDWPRRLLDWIAAQPAMATAVVVGGGRLADCVRDYNRRFSLGEETSHWLCIRALSLHAAMAAELLARKLPEVRRVERLAEIGELARDAVCVFDPEPFLREEEWRLPGVRLPHSWEVTTDSIAARIAECAAAEELVLLKSAPADSSKTDLVDKHFELAASGIRKVRFVDLRSEPRNAKLAAVDSI